MDVAKFGIICRPTFITQHIVKTPQNFVTEVWRKRVKNWILIKGVGDPTPTEIGNAIVVRF